MWLPLLSVAMIYFRKKDGRCAAFQEVIRTARQEVSHTVSREVNRKAVQDVSWLFKITRSFERWEMEESAVGRV